MKILIVLIVFNGLLIIGCADSIYPSEYEKAISLCADKGGIARIYVAEDRILAFCQDDARKKLLVR